jgi:hypothetical protein
MDSDWEGRYDGDWSNLLKKKERHMILTAVACFVGAFSALLAMAEVQTSNKWFRYLAAFLVGFVVTVLLALFLTWVAGLFAQFAH